MRKASFQAELKCNIPVFFLQEGETVIAHSPVLDLSACGKNFNEAEKNFDEVVSIFFEECIERGTLATVLESLGWQRERENSHNRFSPPTYLGERQVSLKVPCIA